MIAIPELKLIASGGVATMNDIYELESGIGQNEVTGIMQIMATLLQLPLARKDDDSDDRNPEIR